MATKAKGKGPRVSSSTPGVGNSAPRTSARPSVPGSMGRSYNQTRPTQPRTPRPEQPKTTVSPRRQRVGETSREYESRMTRIRFNRSESDRAEDRTDPERARARRTLQQTEYSNRSSSSTPNRNYSNRRGGR